MATKTFGKELKTSADYVAEIYKLAGVNFPLTVCVVAGKLTNASYDTTWQTGGTTPVEVEDKKTGEVTLEYKENYTKQKLTAAQIKKIDAYLKENVEA